MDNLVCLECVGPWVQGQGIHIARSSGKTLWRHLACPRPEPPRLKSWRPDVGWKWMKWTFGVWRDPQNHSAFGIDCGPLEIVWRHEGYRP